MPAAIAAPLASASASAATPARTGTPVAAHAPPSAGLILLLGSMTAVGAMSTDLYLPSLPTLGRALGASPGAVGATISAFMLGMGLGQLVHGPLSDRYGRRRPLIAGLTLYIAASTLCATAPSIGVLTLGRLLQGLGGCAALVISRGVVRDRYGTRDSARIFSTLTLVLGVAPVLAPLGGSGLLALFGWRAIFVVLTGFGAAVLVATVLALPETRGAAAREAARAAHPVAVYARLLTHRRLLGYMLAMALSAACLMVYVASSATLFIADFGISPTAFSGLFASNAVVFIGSAQINRRLLARHSPDAIIAVALRVAVVIGLAFAAAAWAGVAGLWVSFGFAFATLATYGFLSANLSAGGLAVDPGHSGSITALSGTATFGMGAVAATLATTFHDGTARPSATVTAVCFAGAWAAHRYLVRDLVRAGAGDAH